VGGYLLSRLAEMKKKFSFITEVRGKGLILGMELSMDGGAIVKEMMQRGFLINYTMGNVLRFLPPLIVTKKDVDQMLEALEAVFQGIK
jgi:acetylornithine/N-succinyldiaminopimelate aminotransferase